MMSSEGANQWISIKGTPQFSKIHLSLSIRVVRLEIVILRLNLHAFYQLNYPGPHGATKIHQKDLLVGQLA